MKVTLETVEYQYQAGIFKRVPKWQVNCKIEFSLKELETIRDKGLGEYIIYTQTIHSSPDRPMKIDLREVIKDGIWSTFDTPREAKEFEALVRDGTLPALKELIEENSVVMEGPQTFEL